VKRALLVLGGLLLVVTAILYVLGRGRVEVAPTAVPPGMGEESRLDSVVLYFGDPDRVGLRPEERAVISGPSVNQRLAAVMQELARGSYSGGLPVIPADTRLRNAFIDPWGIAYLDFQRTLLGPRAQGDTGEWMAVASIVHTVCANFGEVSRIRFMIDGQSVTSLFGYIDLEEPLDRGDFPLTAAGH
jgi:spore germination protein GerM